MARKSRSRRRRGGLSIGSKDGASMHLLNSAERAAQKMLNKGIKPLGKQTIGLAGSVVKVPIQVLHKVSKLKLGGRKRRRSRRSKRRRKKSRKSRKSRKSKRRRRRRKSRGGKRKSRRSKRRRSRRRSRKRSRSRRRR